MWLRHGWVDGLGWLGDHNSPGVTLTSPKNCKFYTGKN